MAEIITDQYWWHRCGACNISVLCWYSGNIRKTNTTFSWGPLGCWSKICWRLSVDIPDFFGFSTLCCWQDGGMVCRSKSPR